MLISHDHRDPMEGGMAETAVKDVKVATVETATAGTKTPVQTKDFHIKVMEICTDSAPVAVVVLMDGIIVELTMEWNRLQIDEAVVVGSIPVPVSSKKPKN